MPRSPSALAPSEDMPWYLHKQHMALVFCDNNPWLLEKRLSSTRPTRKNLLMSSEKGNRHFPFSIKLHGYHKGDTSTAYVKKCLVTDCEKRPAASFISFYFTLLLVFFFFLFSFFFFDFWFSFSFYFLFWPRGGVFLTVEGDCQTQGEVI